MDLNTIITGLSIQACVVLATTVTGLIKGNRVCFEWNGVKVIIGDHSDGEQAKTDKVSDISFKLNNFEINIDQRYCTKHGIGVQNYFTCKKLIINR